MYEFPFPKKRLALLTALGLLAFTSSTFAQLYTWKDTQGNAIIKNVPPPWYSESERTGGARVQVLRNGKVIDDTAWPTDKRQEGRNKAASNEARRARPENAALPAKKDDDE